MSVAYGEQQRNSSALSASGAGGQRELERQYHVVLQDSLGHPALGFREGTWFRITVSGPQPLQLRGAIRTCPHAAGSIVQIACWWMRENPMQPRSLDLATELALTVGELVRVCPADGLGTTSMDLLPMAMAAVAQSGPPVTPAPALPSVASGYSTSGSGFGSTPALGSSASSSAGSSDAFGSGSGFGSQSALGSSGSYTSSGSYGSSGAYSTGNDALYGSSTTSSSATGYSSSGASGGYGQTSTYGSSSGYETATGSSTASSGTYGSTSTYGSSTTDAYSSGSSAYGTSSSSASGYGSTASSGGYGSSSTSAYSASPYANLADPLTDSLDQAPYSTASDPLGQSSYSTGSYAASSSYDAAQTSYLPVTTGASAAENGWFEPADGTGTGGFPAVPPAPVMGRPAPKPPAPPAPKPYSSANPGAGAGRGGYGGGATPQAALPPASRPRESGADWEPRAAAPRRPGPTGAGGSSHQPRPPQSAAPRPVPGVPGATGQQPRPRPAQPRDGYGRPAEPQDPGRSSDRNPVQPRRPAPPGAANPPQRGTMGRRPATRPGRPSER